MKERMYTHNASVHVVLPNLPSNQVLAVDGRGNTHLQQQNKRKFLGTKTGTLFWIVERTSVGANANLQLEMTLITSPEVHIEVPGLPKHKMAIARYNFPQVPILVNKKTIPIHTKLVAVEDKVIMRIRDQEIKAKRERDDATKLEADAKNMKPNVQGRSA